MRSVLELSLIKWMTMGEKTAGVYIPGDYKEEAKAFFKECVGEEVYEHAMNTEAGRRHHYVAARAYLGQKDWEKFVWIEQYGSLEGFESIRGRFPDRT